MTRHYLGAGDRAAVRLRARGERLRRRVCFFFLLNDPATPEIYTLSLHDALPISAAPSAAPRPDRAARSCPMRGAATDRKSTRLNSSHVAISYAVFCLKKKNLKVLSELASFRRHLHSDLHDSAAPLEQDEP